MNRPAPELAFRFAVVRVGCWLGWASIAVVLADLLVDRGTPHRSLLLGATLAVATGNAGATAVARRDWLSSRRGLLLLDVWCGGLIAFVALLVAGAGAKFTVLLFLAVPFIAVVQAGVRRVLWLAVSAAMCIAATAFIPLSAGATAMRLGTVAAAVAVVLLLTRTIRREAAAHRDAAHHAELERALAQEASHRIKNDLQTAADLLLLGRPDGAGGAAFDEAAARIHVIATVHRLLTETRDRVDVNDLLRSITSVAPGLVEVDADAVVLDAATAQKLGLVANELVTNAFRHGTPPIVVRLSGGPQTRLLVEDRGAADRPTAGLGLSLVRRMVEHGLGGRFELDALADGGTRAEVVFPAMTR